MRTLLALSMAVMTSGLALPAGVVAQEVERRDGEAGGAAGIASETRAEVERTLDAFHRAASEADGSTYFALFTADGVFLGTDATERWTVQQFREYAKPHFDRGRGWTYTPLERHVTLGPQGQVAWFDERLHNEWLGETRGSGVLVRGRDGWRVAQYNLTIPIPNDLAAEVVEMIRALDSADEVGEGEAGETGGNGGEEEHAEEQSAEEQSAEEERAEE